MRSRSVALGLVAAVALLSSTACGGSSGKGASTSTTAAQTTTTALPAMPTSFSWWSPAPTALGNGWTISSCDPSQQVPQSQGKVLCLNNKDGRQAVLEHFRFAAPADGNLNHHAAQFVQDFLNDRKAGCGQAYRVDAEPIDALNLPDGPARRYGFTGGAANAPNSERTVQWAGIRGPALVIVTISGYDPGSCVPSSGQGTLEDLTEIIPGLHALVLAAGLPTLTP
jgi:hypothetical protein